MEKPIRSLARRRDVLKAAGAGLGVASTAGCLGGGGSSSDGPITIAAIQPLSGPFASVGPLQQNGVEFAIEQINADGGVLDRDLEVELVDSENDPQLSRQAYTRLIEQEGAVAGTGPGASSVGIQTSEVAENKEVPMFICEAGVGALTSKDDRYTFRTGLPAAPTDMQAHAQIVEQEGFTNIGAIFEDAAWGNECRAGIERYFPDDVTLHSQTAPIPETDFVPLLRNIPNDIECLLTSTHPAGSRLVYNQAKEIGMDPEIVIGPLSHTEVDYELMGDKVDEGYISWTIPDPYSEKYQAIGQAYYEEKDDYFGPIAAIGYMAVDIIAKSIERAGEASGPAIADAARNNPIDTIAAAPIEYSDWGNLDNCVQIYNAYDLEAPPFYPPGEIKMTEYFRSEPIPAFDPDEFDM